MSPDILCLALFAWYLCVVHGAHFPSLFVSLGVLCAAIFSGSSSLFYCSIRLFVYVLWLLRAASATNSLARSPHTSIFLCPIHCAHAHTYAHTHTLNQKKKHFAHLYIDCDCMHRHCVHGNDCYSIERQTMSDDFNDFLQ